MLDNMIETTFKILVLGLAAIGIPLYAIALVWGIIKDYKHGQSIISCNCKKCVMNRKKLGYE